MYSHLATRYKVLLLQRAIVTTQPEDISFRHKSERCGRILKASLPYYCCCNKLPQAQWLKTNLLSYSPGCQKSKMGWQGCISSEVSRGESVSLPFQVFRGCLIPWLMALSSVFKTSSIACSNHSLTLTVIVFFS